MKTNHNRAVKYRLPKTKGNRYVCVANSVVDARLPANAFQVLMILLRDADDYAPNKENLLRRVTFRASALDTALKQLKEAGYLRIVQDAVNPGVWVWYVYEAPTHDGHTTTVVPRSQRDDNGTGTGVSWTSPGRTKKEDYKECIDVGTTAHTLSVTHTNICTKPATGEIRETTPSSVRAWRSAMEADEQFQSLDQLRRSTLGVDDTVRQCDYEAFLKAWQDLRCYSDDDADSIKGLTEIVVGAVHDPRGIETRRQFASWDELLDTTNGQPDRCRAWFVIHELDETPTDDFEVRVRANQVRKAGTMTGTQFRILGKRHPLILDAVELMTKARAADAQDSAGRDSRDDGEG